MTYSRNWKPTLGYQAFVAPFITKLPLNPQDPPLFLEAPEEEIDRAAWQWRNWFNHRRRVDPEGPRYKTRVYPHTEKPGWFFLEIYCPDLTSVLRQATGRLPMNAPSRAFNRGQRIIQRPDTNTYQGELIVGLANLREKYGDKHIPDEEIEELKTGLKKKYSLDASTSDAPSSDAPKDPALTTKGSTIHTGLPKMKVREENDEPK